jgi:hypothetical protein
MEKVLIILIKHNSPSILIIIIQIGCKTQTEAEMIMFTMPTET